MTGYQTCIQEGTVEYHRFARHRTAYLERAGMLCARSLFRQIAEEEGYHYSGGYYFLKHRKNPTYQTLKWGHKSAVIAFGAGTYSYLVDGWNLKGTLSWSPFSINKYIELVNNGTDPVDRRILYTAEDVESWITISRLKTKAALHGRLSDAMKEKLHALAKKGFLELKDGAFELSETGFLIEDLIYASIMPKTTWNSFRQRREEVGYGEEARFDWFFEPGAVLRFQRAIGI
jgi:coproporphyrinogen III oxidase-like Fe-S oxidoreductase